MAGQYQIRHIRLVAFLVLACLAAALVRRIAFSRRSLSSLHSRSNWSLRRELIPPSSDPHLPTAPRIHGRWEAVRASLGLPPLPHEVVFTPARNVASPDPPDKRASRFDLARKRRADEQARRLSLLHFAPDTRPSSKADNTLRRATNKDHRLPDSREQET